MFGKKVVVSGVAGLLMLGVVAGSVSAQTPPNQGQLGPRWAAGQQGAQQTWQGRGPGAALGQAAGAPRGGMLGQAPVAAQGLGRGAAWGATSDSVAKLLGMTAEQIHSERQAGKSLAQLAQEKGVTQDALVNALVESREAALDARVKAGTLTQQQADEALKLMKDRIADSLDRTEIGPNRPADGQGQGLAWGRGQMGRQLGPQGGAGLGPRGPRR